MYYRIRVTDYTENTKTPEPTEARVKTLVQAYRSQEEAAEHGWTVIAALAALSGLDYENQGDQYMAYYREGHPCAGLGAYTVEIIDENNNPQDL